MDSQLAECRGCRQALRGKPYHMGGRAWRLDNGKEARSNHYGGFVCSKECDRRASLEHERSMPGHGDGQMRLSCYAQESLDRNWADTR